MILGTNPASVVQAAAEDIVWAVDLNALLSGDETVINETVALTEAATGATIPLVDDPLVVAGAVEQRVRVAALTAGHQYRMTVKFTPSGTTNVLVSVLKIVCPF